MVKQNKIYDNNGYLITNMHNFTPKKIIKSNRITTQGMAFPIVANGKVLHPNTGDYIFPTNRVVERPLYQSGGAPTTSDSLDLMNNTNALLNYYKNYNLKKNKNILDTKDLAKLEEYYLSDVNRNFNIKYPTSSGGWDVGKLPKNIKYINVDKNKFKKREDANIILDTRSPMQLIDRRIAPSVNYSGMYSLDELGSDAVTFYGYDPIVVKPAYLKTAADYEYVKKNYPELYKKVVDSKKVLSTSPNIQQPQFNPQQSLQNTAPDYVKMLADLKVKQEQSQYPTPPHTLPLNGDEPPVDNGQVLYYKPGQTPQTTPLGGQNANDYIMGKYQQGGMPYNNLDDVLKRLFG